MVVLVAELRPTLTVTLNTLLPAAAMAVELVQVITLPPAAPLQLQLAALVPPKEMVPEGIVKPVGNLSTTVIKPVVGEAPTLLAVRV